MVTLRRMIPEPVKPALRWGRDLMNGTIRRRTQYRRHGLKFSAGEAFRTLAAGGRLNPYQPLYGAEEPYLSQFPATKRFCDERWTTMAPHLPTSGSAMDIGSQNGYFVFQMATHGLIALGIEREDPAYRASQILALLNSVDRASFVHLEITDATVRDLPTVDVVVCMAVFHHWVHQHDLDYATRIMRALAARTGSVMVFETGQPDQTQIWWSQKLGFMGDNPRPWIDDFLKDLGFAQVQHVGEFVAKEQSKFKRHLFICKK
jgi:hypothetical protein